MPADCDPQTLFDRVLVINLDRRPDRLDTFLQAVGAMDWPFAPPQRYRAIDGGKVGVPPWWRAGAGAWGAFMSHLRAIEDALQDDVSSLLIFEDDALFCDDFASRAAAFTQNLPDDWHSLYLGGEHLHSDTSPPQPVAPGVVRAGNVNRLHAWAARGEYLATLYRWLQRYYDHAKQHITAASVREAEHIDHRIGKLIETGAWNVYAASPFLVGQRGGKSDVNHKIQDDRFW